MLNTPKKTSWIKEASEGVLRTPPGIRSKKDATEPKCICFYFPNLDDDIPIFCSANTHGIFSLAFTHSYHRRKRQLLLLSTLTCLILQFLFKIPWEIRVFISGV